MSHPSEPATPIAAAQGPAEVAPTWVELRVHGVSGTPPESILLSKFVVQTGGDERGRFFRPADSLGIERQLKPGRILEAFHWGRFTSGSWTQALWLLIIPFGIVNAASFMLPPIPGDEAGGSEPDSGSHRWARFCRALAMSCLRIIALGLTCLFVFSSVVAAIDLLAWQLGNAGDGSSRRYWLIAGMAWPLGALWLFGAIGKVRGAGQLPNSDRRTEDTVATSTRSAGRNSAAAEDDPDSGEQTDADRTARIPRSANTGFADPDFFGGDPDVPTLRRLHQAAAIAMVAVAVCWPFKVVVGGWTSVISWVGVGLIAATVAVVAFLGDPQHQGDFGWWHGFGRAAGWLLFSGAAVLTLVVVAVVWRTDANLVGRSGSSASSGEVVLLREMPGIAGIAMMLLSVVTAALLVLGLAVFGAALAARARRQRLMDDASPEQRSKIKAFQPFGAGMAGWLMAAVGSFVAVGFAAAFDFAVQAVVRPLQSGFRVAIPEIQQRAGYAWGLTVLMLVVVGVVMVPMWGRKSRFEAAALASFRLTPLKEPPSAGRVDVPPTQGLPPAWLSKVTKGMYLARLKNSVPGLMTLFAIVGTVFSLVAGIEQMGKPVSDDRWWRIVNWMSELESGSYGWIAWLGANALALLSLGLVVLGRGAIRAEAARRGLNVVWDVIAFWPRAVHPFVPPPYSQNVVALLRRRVSWHLGTLVDPTAAQPCDRPEAMRRRVVIAAHSQGSLITLAALLWLRPDERARVGVVTFGSQIQQQFAKAFPRAVNAEVVDWIWASYAGRWRNLYRDTDPIAGPALSWQHSTINSPMDPVSNNLQHPANRDAPPAEQLPDPIDPRTGRRSCGPDWRLLDPPRADLALMGSPMTTLFGHSDYPQDPDWDVAVQEVLAPVG